MEFLRKNLGLMLRLGFSGGVLVYLARKYNWSDIWGHVRTADPAWLMASLLILGATMVAGTYRWKVLLHVQHIDLPMAKLFPINMIGQFFNAFLLGVTGGDVLKIYYAAQAAPHNKSAAGLSVVYDRILGLLALMLWGLSFIAWQYTFLASTPSSHLHVWVFLVVSAAAFGGMTFAMFIPWIRKNSGLWQWEQRLPFHDTLEKLSDSFQRYARNPGANLLVLGLSLIIHGCLFVSMLCIAYAIHMPVNFWPLAAVVSIINLLIAIPVNVGGLGVRENAYVVFLGLLGIPGAQATAFSLLGFVLNIVWSLVGGIYFMKYKKHESPVAQPLSA